MLVGNELSEEEQVWMAQLAEAAKAEGLTIDSRFMLASFAIVGKGDIKKSLKRVRNWNKVNELYKLKETTEAEATKWMVDTMSQFMICVGTDKEGLGGYGVHLGSFTPSVVKTEYDERCIIRAMADNMRSNTPTIAEVRKGAFTFTNMEGIGWGNISMSLEKKISSVYQDAYPFKMKKTYLVNPPSFLFVLLHAARLFIKKKLIDRIQTCKPEDLPKYFDQSQIPESLGGGMKQSYWDRRAENLKVHRASVAEMESGHGPMASTVSM